MNNKIENFLIELNKKFPKGDTPYSEGFIGVVGKKYTKIARSRDMLKPVSAYAFVNNVTGELFKPAGWAAPAKHVRGNVNDSSGLAACGAYGVTHLR